MDLWKTVHDHFASPPSVRSQQQRVKNGLRVWERQVLEQYHTESGLMLNIGCGSGRESLALHQLNYRVVGVDIAWRLPTSG